jgi:hypothetical protein
MFVTAGGVVGSEGETITRFPMARTPPPCPVCAALMAAALLIAVLALTGAAAVGYGCTIGAPRPCTVGTGWWTHADELASMQRS